jgi:acyl dehydratase
MSHIRQKAIAGLNIGDKFSVSRTFSEQDVVQFAALSRDYNPIHFDERFSKVKNFDGLICHGLLVASLITEIGGQIGWLASGMSFTFKKPVYIGDTIQCDLVLLEIDARGRAKAEAMLTNQHHITVLEAVLFGIIPGREEKQVLRAMTNEGDPTNKVSHENISE